MSLFKSRKTPIAGNNSAMAELALNLINEGVVVLANNNVVVYANPAAIRLTGVNSSLIIGIDYQNVLKFCSEDGTMLVGNSNPLYVAVIGGQPVGDLELLLVAGENGKQIPVSVNMIPAGNSGNKIITIRDITKESMESSAQADFISTASHEMRTPVASIEGYLSLALNPQTATIDERAKGYLNAAHESSVHLGNLFRDLLDTTKLEDGILKPRMVPCEMVQYIHQLADAFAPKFAEAKLKYQFGTNEVSVGHNINQVVYGFVDPSFMQEILNNLMENAAKYTPEGGSVWVNARGDGDKILINVTDTGIGVSADDLQHIFQKFYRADNSQTRTVGGTGLGLYLVKQRVEAMGGRVWAESAFGEGTSFFISLPRLSADEYEKRMVAYRNAQAVQLFQSMNVQQSQINNTKGQQ